MNWFEAFFKRLTSDTPSFFKKVIAFGIMLGAIGAGLKAAPESIELPLWLLDQADNFIIAGFVAGIVAKAAVKESNPLSQ